MGFEPAIPAGERLQTHALDRSATGIGRVLLEQLNINLTGQKCLRLLRIFTTVFRDGHCKSNVTLTRVREIIIAVEK
jgi:hypothetical protein